MSIGHGLRSDGGIGALNFTAKIAIPVVIGLGLSAFMAFIVVVVRSGVFRQHPVCIYVIGIAISNSLLLLLTPGLGWTSLLHGGSPWAYDWTSTLCGLGHFLDGIFRSFANWIVVFALVDRYLFMTKSGPRPKFCSNFFAGLTTAIVLGISVVAKLGYPFLLSLPTKESTYSGNPACGTISTNSTSSTLGIDAYFHLNEVVFSFLPFVVALIFVLLVHLALKKAKAQQESVAKEDRQLTKFVCIMAEIHVACSIFMAAFYTVNLRRLENDIISISMMFSFVLLPIWPVVGLITVSAFHQVLCCQGRNVPAS